MILRILLFSLALASLNACFKVKDTAPKPDLPPLTTEGKNTFGCYVNGVPWKEGTPGLNVGGPTLEPSFYRKAPLGDSLMVIRGWKFYYQQTVKYEILDLIFHPDSIGRIIITPNPNQVFIRVFTESQIKPRCIYLIDTTKIHEINLIRFDLDERIVSGTFEMTLYNTTTCNDTLEITDGRFDVRFMIE